MKAADFIRLCSRLVPADRRAAWRRQWEADLACQEAFLASEGRGRAAIQRDLRARSFGALRHAVWFRFRQWSTLMIFQDLRYAARSLRQRPAFTAAAVLTLGLAIGANATIFSWIDALVLNPLPGVPRASELVVVRFATPTRSNLSFSYPNFQYVRDARPAGVAGIAVHDLMPVSLRVDGAPERMWAQIASANLFDVLEVRAALGRTLQPSDDRAPGQSAVVVVSHDVWRTRFASDEDIAGRAVSLNGRPFTVVGVAPEGFHGATNGLAVDLWVPVTMHGVLTGRSLLDARGSGWLQGIARLSPGADAAAAAASLRVVADRMVSEHLMAEDRTLRVGPMTEDGAASVLLPVVAVVMGVVGLVLLIACANVSGLLLARAVSREHEIAIRAALGAGRGRLARQMLLESFLLAALGGAAGVLMSVWTSRGLDALLPPLPFPVEIGAALNGRVLAFSAGIVLLATFLFGLAPALHGSRAGIRSSLGSRGGTPSRGRARLRRLLVAAQVAIAMVLLIAAGLFVRTLANAYDVDPGFDRREAVLASFDLSAIGYDETKGRAFFDELLRRAQAIPGVEAASLSTIVPLTIGGGSDTSPVIDGYTPADNEEMAVYYGMVAPGYFETMAISIVAGRPIDARDRDGAMPAVVINETMARRYWSGRDPVGGRLRIGPSWTTVVGVAKDGKYGSLSEPPRPVMYFPIDQIYRPNPVLHVATRGRAEPAIGAVRQTVQALAPDLAVYDVRTLEEHMQMSVAIPRMAALLLGIFGGLALVLAAIGLYGVIAFVANQRTQEIGVRMALGADRARILRRMLGEGVKPALAGLAAGGAAAAMAMPLVRSQLVNVSPTDVATFAATGALLFAVALAAAFLPALRASRLDPVKALRAD